MQIFLGSIRQPDKLLHRWTGNTHTISSILCETFYFWQISIFHRNKKHLPNYSGKGLSRKRHKRFTNILQWVYLIRLENSIPEVTRCLFPDSSLCHWVSNTTEPRQNLTLFPSAYNTMVNIENSVSIQELYSVNWDYLYISAAQQKWRETVRISLCVFGKG